MACGGAWTIGYSTLAVTFDDERIVGLADVRLAQTCRLVDDRQLV